LSSRKCENLPASDGGGEPGGDGGIEGIEVGSVNVWTRFRVCVYGDTGVPSPSSCSSSSGDAEVIGGRDGPTRGSFAEGNEA
jgi:hypothetical protein